jgi:hypothetical protein
MRFLQVLMSWKGMQLKLQIVILGKLCQNPRRERTSSLDRLCCSEVKGSNQDFAKGGSANTELPGATPGPGQLGSV